MRGRDERVRDRPGCRSVRAPQLGEELRRDALRLVQRERTQRANTCTIGSMSASATSRSRLVSSGCSQPSNSHPEARAKGAA